MCIRFDLFSRMANEKICISEDCRISNTPILGFFIFTLIFCKTYLIMIWSLYRKYILTRSWKTFLSVKFRIQVKAYFLIKLLTKQIFCLLCKKLKYCSHYLYWLQFPILKKKLCILENTVITLYCSIELVRIHNYLVSKYWKANSFTHDSCGC